MKLTFSAAALAATMLLLGCDSAGNIEDATPITPPNIITGFYVVLEAPATSTVSYVLTEFNASGVAVHASDPVMLEVASAGARVVDLFQTGMDPGGVSVTAKLTSGSGTLRIQLWRDDAMESSAETARLNHSVCVTGGSCPN